MVARAVKHKMKHRFHSNASNASNSSDILKLQNTIDQLRSANVKLVDENRLLQSKCSSLESNLASVQNLLLVSQVKCESLQRDCKALEDKSLEVSIVVNTLKEENVVLVHKVDNLNLQLSQCVKSSPKVSNLKSEINKLKNVNDVLKVTARKFEFQLNENIGLLANCALEKESLSQQMVEMENSYISDYNCLTMDFMVLKKSYLLIKSAKDPPQV